MVNITEMDEEKKVERKRKRFAARLKSSKGVMCTDSPERSLVLCNVGQATGIDKEFILKLIEHSALNLSFEKFIAEKGESHSFLVFKSTEDAVQFFNTFNGTILSDKNVVLYINFVENVPNTDIICEHDNPAGLHILQDFITKDKEVHFLSIFDWNEDSDNSVLKNRLVKHYGYEFRYGSNDVDLGNPISEKIPEECSVLWTRLKESGFDLGVPDQLTVNKYCPGQGIPSHVDKHSPFGSTILSLSLGSSVTMDWKHHSGKYVPVNVPARSMLVMQGEARYDWQHGIQPRNYDPIIQTQTLDGKSVKVITNDTRPRGVRISLTFRWTRSGPCECVYRTLCDRREGVEGVEVGDDVAAKLEELHVHQVYEQIAGHFSTTRHKPWPKVVEFTRGVPPGAVLVDLGCGNGKNLLHRNDVLQLACERSQGLALECSRHAESLPAADTLRLDLLQPSLRPRCADAVICIAVVHHFTTRARRLQALTIISELLRPGGRALVTVWAKDQKKSNYICKTKTQNDNEEIISVGNITLPVHENRTQFKHNDLLVPWKLRSKKDDKLSNQPDSTLLRYYHVFDENELPDLCKEIPEIEVESSFFEEGNWCVIFRKI